MAEASLTADTSEQTQPGPANRTWALFLVSLLGLFLELMLIRWVSTEIRIFAYLQNTVLVVCFMGMGMGCWTCRKPFVLRDVLAPLFILVLLLAIPVTRVGLSRISEMLSVFADFVIWEQAISVSPWQTGLHAIFGLCLTFVLMVLIWEIFLPIGRLMGRLMEDHPQTIRAYSVNVAGSLIGIWLFVLLSAAYQPPAAWMAVVALLMLFFVARSGTAGTVELVLLAGIVALSWAAGRQAGALELAWSPYQKLTLMEPKKDQAGKYLVNVNNAGYQVMIDLSEEHTRKDTKRFAADMNGLSQYDMPALLHPKPKNMLIVGAGTGNDAAGGLRHQVRDITAVDIDPAIISMGRRFHPEKPYADGSGVRVVNDDARSFFATCQDRYDVISFGLLDSHTTTAMTNARLDHYVYTRESLQRAKSLLADGGVMVLSFEAQRYFIADRIARAIHGVFGEKPICFRIPPTNYGWGGVMFVTGDLQSAKKQIERNPRLSSLIAKWDREDPVPLNETTRVATDDWPYIYLETTRVPFLYYLLMGMLLLLFVRGLRRLEVTGLVKGWNRTDWHFFFMGAAFLLLEVQNISKAAVVLGNTWQVNAVIISGILAMILIANWIVAQWPELPLGAVYACLCGTCIGLYFIDISQFAFLPYATKIALVGGLTSLPMLFSGIVFIRSFANVVGKDKALGANLMGALVGGVLQSITFVIGIKALLLVVTCLYLGAFLTKPRTVSADKPVLGSA